MTKTQSQLQERQESREFRRELLGLAIPLSLQNLLNALVGASDALMLGRLTQDAVAAVSLANQISFVMNLFTSASLGAVSILIAQYWGKKDYKNSRRFLGLAIRYSAVISIVFFLLAFFIPGKLMRFFTPDPELVRIGAGYLRIVSFSYLFQAISQCFLSLMKIAGKARLSVWISAVTVIVDMSVDFFLIYGRGPIPSLGADGSAYSTIAVEAVALIWCILWARRNKETKLSAEELFKISAQHEKDAWQIIPGLLAAALSWGLSITAHSFVLGHLGSDATAASSVMDVAESLIQCLGHGLASGAGIMTGKLLGLSEFDKAKRYGKRFWKVSVWCGFVNIGLLCIVGPLVYYFYVLSPTAKSYLVQMILYMMVYLFAFSFNAIITSGVFPAGGDSRYDAMSVGIATWCIAMPLALLGCFVFHWPVMTVYSVMFMDEIIKVPAIPFRYRKYIWVRNLTHEDLGRQ